MIQYNLDRLKSAPANKNYRKNWHALMCPFIDRDGNRCKRWRTEAGRNCDEHQDGTLGRYERKAR